MENQARKLISVLFVEKYAKSISVKISKKDIMERLSEFANCAYKFLRNLYTQLTPRFL